jgi:hypothetical protein
MRPRPHKLGKMRDVAPITVPETCLPIISVGLSTFSTAMYSANYRFLSGNASCTVDIAVIFPSYK